MADDKILAETGAEQLVFAPTDQLPIRFSDAFLVAGGDDIFTLNFYQTELPSVEGKVGKAASYKDAKCVALLVSRLRLSDLLDWLSRWPNEWDSTSLSGRKVTDARNHTSCSAFVKPRDSHSRVETGTAVGLCFGRSVVHR